MDPQSFEEIARSSQTAELPVLAPREARLPALPGKADAVIGMRRVGKTSLLWADLAARVEAGLPRERAVYVNFEDDRLAGTTVAELHLLSEAAHRLGPAPVGAERWYYLDEIQNVPGWERFARRLLDSPGSRVAITGSSARLLSSELATSMRGRSLTTTLYPLSFREFLDFHQVDRTLPPDEAGRGRLEAAFDTWLEIGGFPEVQRVDARLRTAILQDYVSAVVLRDVLERHALTNVAAVRAVARLLLAAPGRPFSTSKATADLRSRGIAVSRELVDAIVGHLADAFLVAIVPIETESERRRAMNPRVVYPIDAGLAAAMQLRASADWGARLETAVGIELLRRGFSLSWVRTVAGFEVDFLARRAGSRPLLVQVCWSLAEPETRARELRALSAANAEYPDATLLVLTRLDAGREGPIAIVPAWRWLLRPGDDHPL